MEDSAVRLNTNRSDSIHVKIRTLKSNSYSLDLKHQNIPGRVVATRRNELENPDAYR